MDRMDGMKRQVRLFACVFKTAFALGSRRGSRRKPSLKKGNSLQFLPTIPLMGLLALA